MIVHDAICCASTKHFLVLSYPRLCFVLGLSHPESFNSNPTQLKMGVHFIILVKKQATKIRDRGANTGTSQIFLAKF